jgi:hypothetical protein
VKLEQAKARAKTGNKVALEAEKEKDAAEKAVEELKRQLQPKRARTDENCRNEQQRVEFHIALACVMPTRETQGTKNGWITRICERLGLKRGKRSQKNGGRPYASDQGFGIARKG